MKTLTIRHFSDLDTCLTIVCLNCGDYLGEIVAIPEKYSPNIYPLCKGCFKLLVGEQNTDLIIKKERQRLARI